MNLDRTGVFLARVHRWGVKPSEVEGSQAIAVKIQFWILAERGETGGWDDWSEYEETFVWGDFYVITKDGAGNEVPVRQLVDAIGWKGSFALFDSPPPEDLQVQIEVEKNGDRHRVQWLRPRDSRPGGRIKGTADGPALAGLDSAFGSKMRALVSSAKKGGTPKPADVEPTE